MSAILSALAVMALAAPASEAAPAGDVRLHKGAGSELDRHMADPPPARRRWFRRTYERMRSYAPWFDERLSWYPDAWAYKDLYAIYADGREGSPRMSWTLRSQDGAPLYIPWGCDGRRCPQYAADPGNAEFRRAWIADARRKLAAGYRGLYVDDASLAQFVGDASGKLRKPIDPRTGAPMGVEAWRGYVVSFLEEVRREFPRAEIAHNALWWVGPPTGGAPRRQLATADWVVTEHAFVEGGLTGGDGPLSFAAYMRYVDAVHRLGRRVIVEADGSNAARRRLLLAGYLMVNNGRDLLASWEGTDPGDVWGGFRLRLGESRGRRYRWRGVWRRDFARGTALLSDPGAPTRTVPLLGRLVGGERVSAITLGDREGAVVLRRNR